MAIPLGNIIYTAVKPIFKIYMIIGVGFFLAKRNILTVETSRNISDMVVSAIMPCLIFNNVVGNLEGSDIKEIGIICFTATLIFIMGGLSAYAIGIVTKAPKRWIGGLVSVGLFANISDLPIAYIQTLDTGSVFTVSQGNKGVAYVIIYLAVQVFYQFNMGLYKLVEWDFRESLTSDVESVKGKSAANSNDLEKSESPEFPVENSNGESEDQEEKEVRINKDQADSESQISSTSSINSTPSVIETPIQDSDQHNEFLRAHATSNQIRRKRSSSSNTTHSLNLSRTRTIELRQQKSQSMHDVINEYSEVDGLRNSEIKRTVSGISEINVKLATESSFLDRHEWIRKFKLDYIFSILENFKRPCSISLVISLTIAMIPWCKALFVQTSTYMPQAPDSLPPLSFIKDFTSYIGAASVPLGLLILGATIARLEVKSMPSGFWKTALGLTATRLIILPIIGCAICTKLKNDGWYSDNMIHFVSTLNWGLPNATSLVYFTAFYTDPEGEDHMHMDCLAVTLIFQYGILFITLPFLVTYTLKVSMGY